MLASKDQITSYNKSQKIPCSMQKTISVKSGLVLINHVLQLNASLLRYGRITQAWTASRS